MEKISTLFLVQNLYLFIHSLEPQEHSILCERGTLNRD